MRTPSSLILTAVAALFPFASVFGLGFRELDQSAEATGRGNAFTATADDPSAIYYNPAGINQLNGFHALSGIYGVSFGTRVRLDSDPHKPFTTKYEPQAVPQTYMTYKPSGDSPVAFGLGLFSPYGFGLKYNDTVPFRTEALDGGIATITFAPVISVQVSRSFSIAAGPTLDYGTAELSRGIFAPGDKFQFKGTGITGGFEAGAMWVPSPMHHFGITYHSAFGIDFQGIAQTNYDDVIVPVRIAPGVTIPYTAAKGVNKAEQADAGIHFPQHLMVGYSFRPTPNWNFEANVDYTDWDSLNTVTLHKASGDAAIPFNYKSSFMYEFGATRTFGSYHVSLGYIYAENSVPSASFSPVLPDSNHHVASIGVGRKMDRWTWDVAYQFTYGPTRVVDNGGISDGQYRFISNAVTLSLGHTF